VRFQDPPPVKLVCGILYHDEARLPAGIQDLADRFGVIDYRSSTLPFEYTDYYFEEMGRPLWRVFVSFRELVDSASLAAVKRATGELEDSYARSNGSRRVLNLDPGYVTASAFVLATAKNYSHRIYLGSGVFAQQELLFERKRIRTLDWTYPDYRSREYQEILKEIRRIYLGQIRAISAPES
jgi:hypothetical protein